MISFANSKDPIQSFLSYSPVRFFIQRLDFYFDGNDKEIKKMTPSVIIFVEDNEMVEDKLKELGFTFPKDKIATYIGNHICYLVQLIDDLEKRRLFNDLFVDLEFYTYEEENQFFEYVKSIDNGEDTFYKELREKLSSREDALKLMEDQQKD